MNNLETKKLPEVCNGCPTSKVAKFIGDFWMLLLVRSLLDGPRRYTDLKTQLAGVSTRTLTQKLEFAQSIGVVERKEFAEAPPRVEYSLTKKGHAFKHIVKAVEKYAADHGEEWK